MKPSLLLLFTVLALSSCISFPKAEADARREKVSDGLTSRPSGDLPEVKTRKNFNDPYFR